MKKKRWIALLLLILSAAAVAHFLRPGISAADRDYYSALLCHVTINDVINDGGRDPRKSMRYVIENGNSDYGLHKLEYNAAAADDALARFAKLDADQQRAARASGTDCQRLMGLSAAQ